MQRLCDNLQFYKCGTLDTIYSDISINIIKCFEISFRYDLAYS